MNLDKGRYKLKIHYLDETCAVVSEDQYETALVINDKEDLILICKRPDGSFVIKSEFYTIKPPWFNHLIV